LAQPPEEAKEFSLSNAEFKQSKVPRRARNGPVPVRKNGHQRPLKDWIPQSSVDEEREVYKMKLGAIAEDIRAEARVKQGKDDTPWYG
jgi:hypothetical protein